MKRELKKKFLLETYNKQDAFIKFHNFLQGEKSAEEYTIEFEHLMLQCDVNEANKQMIARYLGGLKSEIANLVELQPYWTLNDVYKLTSRVE